MNIVYFSPVAYDSIKQRPQHIAEELAQRHQVYYIDPTIRFTSCVLHGGREYRGTSQGITEKLTVIRCNGIFVIPFRWNVYDIFSFGGIWERHQLKSILRNADIIIVGFEGWYNVLKGIKGKKIIYDKMDDNVLLSKTWQVAKYLKRAEQKLLKNAECMLVTAKKFFEDYKDRVTKIYLVPNGVKLDKVDQLCENQKQNITVFGYVGMISDWFDMEVIEMIASLDNVKIILAGPCEISPYKKENVVYMGRIPKKDVGNMIKSFDVCLYPFKQGELLDTINPVKIYEYLAVNKPVIAVDSRETRAFGELVNRYHNLEELRELCEKELKKPFRSEEECTKFIQDNSWQARAEQINKILEEM